MAYKRIRTRTITKRTPFGPQRFRVAMGAYSDLPAQGPSGDCGADQKYDPSFVFAAGMAPGQCVNQSQYNAYHAGQSSSSSGGGFFDNLAAGFASVFKPASPVAPVMVQGGGIGTGTALAIGGGALLLVILMTRK